MCSQKKKITNGSLNDFSYLEAIINVLKTLAKNYFLYKFYFLLQKNNRWLDNICLKVQQTLILNLHKASCFVSPSSQDMEVVC